ncbi:hypothetical protein Dtox_2269 [Desulfofarcimen acetoxidans DSM 771]|jgi:hypothetical protein|uniref:YtxH domain-containing protein n=1 Tax=Desulfofarcimen acetoxidans (strain ATCC 49208 / DSM 771 / KCTC 5769 / VKM B-1644 / 5575) TaxID=485916 RepID=C8VZV5_DESAS|nr:hypothetical protein [Desulfofarcimen acetoxidans]ACV63083.1 hypothetical protein Dtox_2269 [Desulfofarcimen acetoxidans DSM 771]
MRTNFWRGLITGSILGALLSMMTGSNKRFQNLSFGSKRKNTSRTRRMLKGVTRTVNDLIK